MSPTSRSTARRLNESYTHDVGSGLALRVYPDKRPGNLEIAGLHKGLVLVVDGVELVEEGAGFGVPVARYRDKTFFPGSAELTLVDEGPPPVLEKSYLLDTVSMKSLGGGTRISDSVYHPLHRAFTRAYLSVRGLRPVFDKVMELRKATGVKTSFVKTDPRGKVNVRFTLHPDFIEVKADMSHLVSGCEEMVLLNEQGASIFRRYADDRGLELLDGGIGAWDRVEASTCTLSDIQGGLSFTVDRPDEVSLYRGRESVPGRFSWAGLTLSLKPRAEIRYTIHLGNE